MIIRQGDAFPAFLHLCHPGGALTPDIVEEVEVCVTDGYRKLYSRSEVRYDPIEQLWYYNLRQQDTLRLQVGTHDVQTRIKYKSIGEDNVKTIWLNDQVTVLPGISKEVL